MLRVWQSPENRPTMDIDMLGKTSNDESRIVAQVNEIIEVPVEPDGLNFDKSSIQTETITKDSDYHGIRVRFRGTLDSARVNMQIDIGFGDVIHPGPTESELPSMLDFPPPRLLCYSLESAIAEKFEAMIKLGILNSRMKDFYDIWMLSRQFDFAGYQLQQAIELTLKHRGTVLTNEISAFQKAFVVEKQVQWTAFRKRLGQEHLPQNLEAVVQQIAEFLDPVAAAILAGKTFQLSWGAQQGWR